MRVSLRFCLCLARSSVAQSLAKAEEQAKAFASQRLAVEHEISTLQRRVKTETSVSSSSKLS